MAQRMLKLRPAASNLRLKSRGTQPPCSRFTLDMDVPDMTAEQFKTAIRELADSYDDAAALLGIGRRSLVRYANDDIKVPEYLRRLVVMYKKHGVPREFRRAA